MPHSPRIEEIVTTDAELAARVAKHAADLGLQHPTSLVRVIISTVPPGYPHCEERPAVPVVVDRLPPCAGSDGALQDPARKVH
jgi:hypothetical protein